MLNVTNFCLMDAFFIESMSKFKCIFSVSDLFLTLNYFKREFFHHLFILSSEPLNNLIKLCECMCVDFFVCVKFCCSCAFSIK